MVCHESFPETQKGKVSAFNRMVSKNDEIDCPWLNIPKGFARDCSKHCDPWKGSESLIPRLLLQTIAHALHLPVRTQHTWLWSCDMPLLHSLSSTCHSSRVDCIHGWYLMIIIWQDPVTLLIRWALSNILVQEQWVFSLLIMVLSTARESKTGGTGSD